MRKPIKPSKSMVNCYACKRRKMLFGEQSEADNFIKYNQGGILEENGKAPVRSYYCELCCGYHVTSNPSKEEGEKLDRQDSQLIKELTSIAQAMDKFKVLGHDLANRIQDCKDQMFIGSFREINELNDELSPYRTLLEKLPLEEKARFATYFRRADFLYAIASKMEELLAVPDNEFEKHVNREFPAISEENYRTVEMMVRLRKMEQSIHEVRSYPDAESREDYKLKMEEIGHYLASIRSIVGRKVTSSYRRKLGLG